jgi:hypothetical protein
MEYEYNIEMDLSKAVRMRGKLNETKTVCNDVIFQS